MNNNKFKKSIVAFILCFFMVFSNIVSTFAYEGDLVVPPIVNNESDVIINSSNDLNDNQVIINGNNDISILTNNSNNINTITNNNITKDTIEQNILTENGRIVKTKIEPVYKNLTRANKQTFTLVGRDKGADATVSFKGDEVGATNHQLIDYITRHNGDNNSVGYCISPFYAGAKENGTTTVEEVTPTTNDKILLGIAVAGYPNNKYNITGLNSLAEEEQYYATLIAMEHFIFQKTGEYKNRVGVKFNGDHWNNTRWFPNPNVSSVQKQKAQQIINVAKEIYTKGVANPYDESKGIATINFTDNNGNKGTMKETGDKYIITIDINSDIKFSDAMVQFTDPVVKQWANANPSKIQFYQGNAISDSNRKYWTTKSFGGQQYEGILLNTNSSNITLTIALDKITADSLITGNTGNHSLDYDVKFFWWKYASSI